MDYMKRQAILSLIEATAACARQVSFSDLNELLDDLRSGTDAEIDQRWTVVKFKRWLECVAENDRLA